jgi:hypothetical protein
MKAFVAMGCVVALLESESAAQKQPSRSGPAGSQRFVPPYPESPVIAGLEWAPTNRILRAARDGDNWPVTWADDDALCDFPSKWMSEDGRTLHLIFSGDDAFSVRQANVKLR